MSKSRAGLLVASMLCATLLLSGCGDDTKNNSYSSAPNLQPKGSVAGTLSDAVTQEAIVGAKVSLLDKSATTNAQGQFLFTDVPANSAVGNELVNVNPGANDAYTVVIDMKDVNAKITEANKKITEENAKVGAVQKPLLALYPGMSYDTVEVKYDSLGETSGQSTDSTNNASFDTPVNGFVASMTPFIGKLDGNLQIQVVDEDLQPVANATVDLFANNSNNNATGANQNLVATQTSDASGLVTFSNVEALQFFIVRGTTSTQNNEMFVVAPADNKTSVYLNNQDIQLPAGNDALVLNDNDTVKPELIDINVEDGSDLAANGAQQVVFTFSEPIEATAYATGLTQGDRASLYNDVAVNFEGLKASNIAYTLAWTKPTELTVTFATAAASEYSVSINAALANLEDVTGNTVPAFIDPEDGIVRFTTFGAPVVVAPVVARVITDTVPQDEIDWLPVPNAAGYAIYVSENINGVSSSFVKIDEVAESSYNFGFNYVDGENKVTFSVKVVALNQDGIESAASTVVLMDDATKNELTFVNPAGVFYTPVAPATTGTKITTGTIIVTFNEQINEASAETLANYLISKDALPVVTTEVIPVITAAKYINAYQVELTVTVTAVDADNAVTDTTGMSDWKLAVSVKDVAGNVTSADKDVYHSNTFSIN